MSLEFISTDNPKEDFLIEGLDQESGTIEVGIGWISEEGGGLDYHLTRDEARQVWEHLGRELGFTEN